MIHKWLREYIENYSFVKSVETKNFYVYVYYELGDKKGWKRISMRANRDKLMEFIEKIKQEINYYEYKQELVDKGHFKVDDKPLIFGN